MIIKYEKFKWKHIIYSYIYHSYFLKNLFKNTDMIFILICKYLWLILLMAFSTLLYVTHSKYEDFFKK